MESSLGLQGEEAGLGQNSRAPRTCPLTPTPRPPHRVAGCRTATQTLKLQPLRLGGWPLEPAQGPREWNQVFTHRTFLRKSSCGRRAGRQPAIGRDSYRETGLPRPGIRDARAGQAAVSLRARRALPPPPAARNAPLTRRPAARRRRPPGTGPPGRPPRGLADKARTAARTPRPEVSPRPRPGNFRRRSRRPGARGPLFALGFRPGTGRARRQGAAERGSQPAPGYLADRQPLRPGTLERGRSPRVTGSERFGFRRGVMPTLEPGGARGAAAGCRQASPPRHHPLSVVRCLHDR